MCSINVTCLCLGFCTYFCFYIFICLSFYLDFNYLFSFCGLNLSDIIIFLEHTRSDLLTWLSASKPSDFDNDNLSGSYSNPSDFDDPNGSYSEWSNPNGNEPNGFDPNLSSSAAYGGSDSDAYDSQESCENLSSDGTLVDEVSDTDALPLEYEPVYSDTESGYDADTESENPSSQVPERVSTNSVELVNENGATASSSSTPRPRTRTNS